jgi:hypothetical protein
VRNVALATLTAVGLLLLLGILVLLVHFARVGLTVTVRGEVALESSSHGVTGDVRLVVEDAVRLVATGPEAGPVPVALAPVPCPSCGGTMVPVRWQPLTGEIEWQCAECDLTFGEPGD